MRQRSLPHDLVRLIVEYLHDDTHTLASLCLLDKETLDLVVSLLYKTVHLSTIQAISQFCDAIIQSERNLGIYPTSIHFVPEDHSDEQLYPIVDPIQITLTQVPNLTDLALGIDTPNLTNLHQYFQHHPPPFSVHRLACHFTPDLMLCLSTQSSIHTLIFYPTHRQHISYMIDPPPSSVLPHLKSITADAHTVIALLPGRPISHVHVPALFSQSNLTYSQLVYRFYRCLGESSAP
ncbi:hypothetical protein BDV93DRAFT_519957 [Ceratobasidium sp. AG-I]|nr:hypothetical protein BDV93DRAFT_519957 [Ceratobasidium sp. AG-I]